MLAICIIRMQWRKENRTPQGAVQRERFYQPLRIEEGVNLKGEGILLVKCYYEQIGDCILSDWEVSDKIERRLYRKRAGEEFTGIQEQDERSAGRRLKSIQKQKGAFYSIDKVDIPCITISRETENINYYRIKWYDGGYFPRRRGGNEDLYKKGARFAGQVNRLNETAFILKEGESGLLKYNFRYTSFEDQWYECYYVYVVNEQKLTHDIFIRSYDYVYSQMADLF